MLINYSLYDSFGGEKYDESGGTKGLESLLNLTWVLFHKPLLGNKTPSLEEREAICPEEPMAYEDVMVYNDILYILSKYKFDMIYESGSKYIIYNESIYKSYI